MPGLLNHVCALQCPVKFNSDSQYSKHGKYFYVQKWSKVK